MPEALLYRARKSHMQAELASHEAIRPCLNLYLAV